MTTALKHFAICLYRVEYLDDLPPAGASGRLPRRERSEERGAVHTIRKNNKRKLKIRGKLPVAKRSRVHSQPLKEIPGQGAHITRSRSSFDFSAFFLFQPRLCRSMMARKAAS